MRGILGLLGVSLAVFANEPYTPQYGPWKSCRMWGGGSMQNVVFCPSEKNRLYTYCDVSGPFRSDDAGKTWYTLEKERMSVRALSVDPRNVDKFVMLAGRTWWIKGGIYVSHDGGKTIEQKVVTRFYGNDLRGRPAHRPRADREDDPGWSVQRALGGAGLHSRGGHEQQAPSPR